MRDKERQEMQERNLKALVENEGFQFTDTFFPYTFGQIGPYYVESTVVEKSGINYREACSDVANLVKRQQSLMDESFDVISGGESRDWDFSNVVAYILGLPHAKIYKNGKILGADMEGKRVAHVSDLNNEGSSPRDFWVPAIRGAGGRVEDIFFYVDRLEDGVQVLEDLGLRSSSVVPLDEHAWNYLLSQDVIPPRVYESLKVRMKDRDAWAGKMLRSDAGFETFSKLHSNENTRAAAEKIMEVGYPDMNEELIDRLIRGVLI